MTKSGQNTKTKEKRKYPPNEQILLFRSKITILNHMIIISVAGGGGSNPVKGDSILISLPIKYNVKIVLRERVVERA